MSEMYKSKAGWHSLAWAKTHIYLLSCLFSSLPPSLRPLHTHTHIHHGLWVTHAEKSSQLQRLTQKRKKRKQTKKAVFPAIKRFSAPQKKVAATIIPANYLWPPQASPVSTVTHGTHSSWDAHHHGNLNRSPVPQCPLLVFAVTVLTTLITEGSCWGYENPLITWPNYGKYPVCVTTPERLVSASLFLLCTDHF